MKRTKDAYPVCQMKRLVNPAAPTSVVALNLVLIRKSHPARVNLTRSSMFLAFPPPEFTEASWTTAPFPASSQLSARFPSISVFAPCRCPAPYCSCCDISRSLFSSRPSNSSVVLGTFTFHAPKLNYKTLRFFSLEKAFPRQLTFRIRSDNA